MLRKDTDKKYIVYPSWIEPTYTWEELPEILSDPFEHDEFFKMTYGRSGLCKLGYPSKPQPFDLLAGPVGGGIIVVDISENKRWLGYGALTFDKGVDIAMPQSMKKFKDVNVSYLEPTYDRGWYLNTGIRTRRYNLNMDASAENIESEPDSIYWLIGFKKRKANKEMKGLSEIPFWGKHFGLNVQRLNEPSKTVESEVFPWLSPLLQYVWYKVEGGGGGFGYHFAVMLYNALHLARVDTGAMEVMHLLSSIEGKPGPYTSGKCKIR